MKLPALYPIVNVADASPEAAERAFALALELVDAGVRLLQLRAKPLGGGEMTQLAMLIVEALSGSGAALIVNDRADVAAAAGAAGVHLGDEDLPVHAARLVLSEAREAEEPRAVIGYSTHSVAEVGAAAVSAADYLGFGPVYESPTKAGVREARGVELLGEACRASPLPIVAIGGITLANASDCWRAGAASVAVISEIERSRDLHATIAKWKQAAATHGLD